MSVETLSYTAEEALELLSEYDPEDFELDHDLGTERVDRIGIETSIDGNTTVNFAVAVHFDLTREEFVTADGRFAKHLLVAGSFGFSLLSLGISGDGGSGWFEWDPRYPHRRASEQMLRDWQSIIAKLEEHFQSTLVEAKNVALGVI